MVTTAPTEPAPLTDNARLLDAMREAYPFPVWNPNSTLALMAHSRASDLRDLGWDVVSVRGEQIEGSRKHHWGYRLASLTERRRVDGAA